MSLTISVPVTLRITVASTDGVALSEPVATAFAAFAAEHFSHVGHDRIAAFNEVNRVHPHGDVVVEAVVSALSTPTSAQ